MIKHQDYIRLHMGPLADGIKKHAHQWMKLYGQKLQESASQSLVSLQELLVVSACINILVILQPARFRDLTCSNHLALISARRVRLSVRPSVCLSDTGVHCDERCNLAHS